MSARYALIGHDISYSKSPWIHRFMAKKLHMDMTYDLLEVEADELKDLIDDLREGLYQGFNVTIPYKEVIIPYLDELTYKAKNIGAVNTIYIKNGIVYGDNTDYDGFVGLLESNQINVRSKNVYILGTGGAAKAVYHALIDLGANVTVVSRNLATKEKIFNHVIEYGEIKPHMVDIYVQATPIGTYPNVNVSVLTKDEVEGKVVIDLIYNPLETQIMKDSKQGISGISMLIIQALKSEEIWFDQEIELTDQLMKQLKEVILDE
ncbi:MAG: shikimate dehydrogenase [Firmicutes bacterium]|nr:shikimate dehydrogenase [Bacillota bacterium]